MPNWSALDLPPAASSDAEGLSEKIARPLNSAAVMDLWNASANASASILITALSSVLLVPLAPKTAKE